MEIVVTGRHTQIKQRFRDVVESKMNRVTAIAPDAQRVQIVLTLRLRRTRDRRKDHRRGYTDPVPVDLGPVEPVVVEEPEPEAPNNSPADAVSADLGPGESVEVQVGDTPIVIRRKLHIAEPMTIDEALYEMELIGHDFFLFVNKETGRPSVVYHRHGWSYGVFEIDTPENVKKA